MNLQILSDLHIEFAYQIPKLSLEVDVLIMAGDLCPILNKTSSGELLFEKFLIEFFAQYPHVSIVFVAGNHEYYHSSLLMGNSILRRLDDQFPSFYFLNNESLQLKNINFIGSTLWTNFRAFNATHKTIVEIQEGINDFICIKGAKGRLQPKEIIRLFNQSCDCIQALKKKELLNVVITHFGPSEQSCHTKYAKSGVSAYFMSNCEHLMKDVPLWIHGHTHSSMNYRINHTRVICNPKGYYDENSFFNSNLVISL